MTNPERDQDRVEDLVDTFRKYGYVMFPQQRRIYEQIAERLFTSTSVLEAGCGNGVGSAILHMALPPEDLLEFVATDKLKSNIEFARCLYPWIEFKQWDITEPFKDHRPRYSITVWRFQAVVCVEALEHVADPVAAIRNLCAAATDEVWISTPNGTGKPRPPSNPYHVCEYTPEEMLSMLQPYGEVTVHDWEDFNRRMATYSADPLVYRVRL